VRGEGRKSLGVPSVDADFEIGGPSGAVPGDRGDGAGGGARARGVLAVYELAKQELGGNEAGYHPLAHAASGALATVASDAVLTPMDVVKQRLQLRRSPYSGVVDCCKKVRGVLALACLLRMRTATPGLTASYFSGLGMRRCSMGRGR